MTQPMSSPGSLTAALGAASMQVTPANVLQVRTALLAEAARLDRVVRADGYQAVVRLCGGDPVSGEAAAGFNEKIHDMLTQCVAYNNELRTAGDAMAEVARGYGITEQQIAASFPTGQPPR